MDDLIGRQAAIDAIGPLQTYKLGEGDSLILISKAEVQTELMMLPSAERKSGHWVRIEDENGDFLCWECSECGERYVMPHHRASYCPNCGAEMRGEEDE